MTGSAMRYESNPKHSDPWQPGRRGARCPTDVTPEVAERLLQTSELVDRKRYAVFEGQAFCAQEHTHGVWHGYPVGWKHVPHAIRSRWRSEGAVRRSAIRANWE